MKIKAFRALLLLLCLLTTVLPQTKAPAPPQKTDDDEVVKITTNLVQVDAVVTKDGKIVPNLTANDFEIYQDGKKQTITSFAYISNVSPAQPANTTSDKADVPFTPFKPDEPHRTIAFVVDDLGLSFESIYQVRRQLRKFAAEELQPNDLVAIIRTGGEMGALQQFTTDRRLLMRAVDQLRWNHCSRVGIFIFPTVGVPNVRRCGFGSYKATMKSLRFIIDSMGQLPGRKSLVLMSDSVPRESQDELLSERGDLRDQLIGEENSERDIDLDLDDSSPLDPFYENYGDFLNKIAEKAVRASVVIYSVDTQGLPVTGITAADFFADARQVQSVINSRSHLLISRREGAELLARQTGGFQIRNSNSFQIDRIMQDQSGYYLLGYRPAEETFNRRFHHIKARVKGSGLSVRTRYGFFGVTEEEATRRQLTSQDLTNLALASPFAKQDLELQLTTFFADTHGDSSLVRSFVNLDLKDLTFNIVNGRHQASIEVHGLVFGDNGRVVQQLKNGATLHFSDSEYRSVLQHPFGINVDMPVKRPGSYQVRVAIRDRVSSKIGSAGAYVAVPNLKNKHLAASGIILGSVPQSSSPGSAAGEVMMNPGARRFRTNSDLHFAFRIYNVAIASGSQLRDLVMESNLFRDGKNVFSSPNAAVVSPGQQNANHVVANGVLRLSPSLEPGHYYLQVVISERGSKTKTAPLEQWIDFEIVK